MAGFDSISDLRDFIRGAPQRGDDDAAYRKAIVEWLASASFDPGGFESEATGEPITLIVMADDSAADFVAYAVPDSQIEDWLREGLESIDDSCFEQHFTADLSDDQWLGALWFLSLTYAENEDDIEDFFEGPIEEMQASDMDVDLDALKARAGAWQIYALRNGAGLNRPISHCYTVNLAM